MMEKHGEKRRGSSVHLTQPMAILGIPYLVGKKSSSYGIPKWSEIFVPYLNPQKIWNKIWGFHIKFLFFLFHGPKWLSRMLIAS